jgi:hypothetical protein
MSMSPEALAKIERIALKTIAGWSEDDRARGRTHAKIGKRPTFSRSGNSTQPERRHTDAASPNQNVDGFHHDAGRVDPD